MDNEKLLIGIKKAEEKARKIVEDAEKKKERILKAANAQSSEVELKEIGSYKKGIEQRNELSRSAVSRKKGEIRKQVEKEVNKVRRSQANVKKAIDYVSKEFDKLLGDFN